MPADPIVELLRATDPARIKDAHHMRLLERAVMLAPTLTICEQLLRREAVPLSKLDALQVGRYGIRKAS